VAEMALKQLESEAKTFPTKYKRKMLLKIKKYQQELN